MVSFFAINEADLAIVRPSATGGSMGKPGPEDAILDEIMVERGCTA